MDTSYPQKLAGLAAALLRSPRDLPGYLGHLPLWGSSPLQSGLPWFSYGAIRRLRRVLRAHQRVLELGSGGSTVFFARHCAHVCSMESDPTWHREVSASLAARGVRNVTCELHPLSDTNADSFRANTFFDALRSGTWDVIVIDCFCGFTTARHGLLRPYAFELALERLNPDGFIVLDDSWMFPGLLQPRTGWRIVDYRGVGPFRYGVTSTALIARS